MSKADSKAIQNAEQVIERFGGIRPMARKLDVAVTTVQGWKKRNVIPGTRYDDIVKAAQEHKVEISDFMRTDIANENIAHKPVVKTQDTAKVSPAAEGDVKFELEDDDDTGHVPKTMPEVEAIIQSTRKLLNETTGSKHTIDDTNLTALLARGIVDEEDLEMRLRAMELKAVLESTMISILMVVIGVVAVGFLLWPRPEINAQKIEELQTDVQIIKKADQQSTEQSRLNVPFDLEQKITNLQEQAAQAQAQVGVAMQRAEAISNDVLAGDAGNIERRLSALEAHINQAAADSPQFAALLGRIQGLQASESGRAALEGSVAEIRTILTSGTGQLDQKLADARQQSASLGQTMEGVPADDLKAAAILLGFTQFRSSLNRGNEPFENDLAVLTQLVGENNPELQESLARLAPHAQSGVLTPAGLGNEFKGLAGDVVVASLKGEDVSIQEKAKARLGELLQVQKDGELITGTETQATVARTQNLLEQGDLAAAIAEVQTLDGPAAQAVQPWLRKAQATLQAQEAEAMLSQVLSGTAGLGRGQLIRNEETGINILRR